MVYRNWGCQGPNPPIGEETLILGCRNIRTEPGWYTGTGYAYMSIGNEGICGDVFINYTQTFPRQVAANTTGVSIPLTCAPGLVPRLIGLASGV